MSSSEVNILINLLKGGKSFYIDDYFGGEQLTYHYDKQRQEFIVNRADTIVGSYSKNEYYSEKEIYNLFLQLDYSDFIG